MYIFIQYDGRFDTRYYHTAIYYRVPGYNFADRYITAIRYLKHCSACIFLML